MVKACVVKALMNTIRVFHSETLVLAQYFSPEKWHLFPYADHA